MGWQVDEIFQTVSNRLEIGEIELGLQDENSDGIKFSEDGLKLQKMLNDQFDLAFQYKPNIVKQEMETLVCNFRGRSMQVISSDWVGGLFLRFRREDKTIMPASMEQFRDLIIGLAVL